jgi:hypothetical protein
MRLQHPLWIRRVLVDLRRPRRLGPLAGRCRAPPPHTVFWGLALRFRALMGQWLALIK